MSCTDNKFLKVVVKMSVKCTHFNSKFNLVSDYKLVLNMFLTDELLPHNRNRFRLDQYGIGHFKIATYLND